MAILTHNRCAGGNEEVRCKCFGMVTVWGKEQGEGLLLGG